MAKAEDSRPNRRNRFESVDLLIVGIFLLAGVLVCARHLIDVTHVTSGLPPDQTFYEWLFSHGAYSLRHLENPLFSFQQNVPNGANLMANPSMLGIVMAFAPATMVLGPQYVYAIYLVLAMAATAATAYLMMRRHLVSSRLAAFAGGAFVAFAPGVVRHAYGQPIWVSNFLLPLIVVRVLKLGEPGRQIRNGVILGLLVACQLFINQEMLLIVALVCAVIVLVYAIERWSEARARAVSFFQSLVVCAAVVVVLAGYPLWFQLFGPQSFRGLQGGVFQNWGEDILAFVTFAPHTIAGSQSVGQTIGATEQNTWFGWPLCVLVLLSAFVLGRRVLVARIASIVALLFAIVSLGPVLRFNGRLTNVPGPWRLISQDLPVVQWMLPARLSFAVVGAVGVLLALTVNRVAKASAEGKRPARPFRLVVYAAVATALLPLVPRPLGTNRIEDPPRFISSGTWRRYVSEGRSLVPIPVPSNLHGLTTLRWSALSEHEFAVPGGYFIGPDPEGKGTFGVPPRPTTTLIVQTIDTGQVPVITDSNKSDAIEDLQFWRASVVVLGRHPLETQLLALMTGLLGPPERVDDVWLWDVEHVAG